MYAAHVTFTVATLPVVGHQLCGDFSYVAKFDGSIVDGDPFTYDSDNSKFTANSADGDLLNEPTKKPNSLEVEFATYPSNTYT